MTDTLKMLGENVAKLSGGTYITRRYIELLTPQKVETKTPEQVKSVMMSKLKALGKGG